MLKGNASEQLAAPCCTLLAQHNLPQAQTPALVTGVTERPSAHTHLPAPYPTNDHSHTPPQSLSFISICYVLISQLKIGVGGDGFEIVAPLQSVAKLPFTSIGPGFHPGWIGECRYMHTVKGFYSPYAPAT